MWFLNVASNMASNMASVVISGVMGLSIDIEYTRSILYIYGLR